MPNFPVVEPPAPFRDEKPPKGAASPTTGLFLAVIAGAAIAAFVVYFAAVVPLDREVAHLQYELVRATSSTATPPKTQNPAADITSQLEDLKRDNEQFRLKSEDDQKALDVARKTIGDLQARLLHSGVPVAPGGPLLTPLTPQPISGKTLAPLPVPTPSATNVLNDAGGLFSIRPNGQLAAPITISASLQPAVKDALRSGHIDTPDLLHGPNGLIERQFSLSGGLEKAPFDVLSPVGTVVRADRPTFRWAPAAGATGYSVSVFDPNGPGGADLDASPVVTSPAWTADKSLPRGIPLRWVVTAHFKNKDDIVEPAAPAPDARFEVLTAADAAVLARDERQYARSHLLLGIVNAHYALLDEAEAEFTRLLHADQQPPSGRLIAQKLLWAVQALRGAGPTPDRM